ncbi:MAG: 2OG-Fe(II) oxygenase [Algibacter sp.]
MKTTYINNLPIIEIDNFFSSDESDAVLSERLNGFQSALSHYPVYYRNNDRFVEDNTNLSKQFFKKLKKLNINGLDEIIGVNNRFRFCRYQKNQLFSKHKDGVHYPNDRHESKYTFLLYLNNQDDFIGGDTEFFTSKYDEKPTKIIKPKRGKLVIFDHSIWHQGAEIIFGNKYILRSDIYVDRQVKSNHHDGYIWSLLKVDENHFFSCGRDTSIKLWNKDLQLVNAFRIHSKSILKIVRLNKKEFVSCSRDFALKKWTNSGKVLSSIWLDEMILNIVINTLEKQIIAVGTSGNIFILNSELVLLRTIKGHKSWIWGIKLIGNDIVTCGEDGAVVLTNLISGKTKCVLKHKEALFSIYGNNKSVFIGTKNGIIIKFSLIKNKVENLVLHKDIVRSIIGYKNEIFTCSEDNRIMRYNVLNGHKEQIRESDNFIQDIIVLNGQIYAAGFDGSITIDEI